MGGLVGSLPHRQLRKSWQSLAARWQCSLPHRQLRKCGDEHGLLYADGPEARLPSLGHMLWLIPGHCDPTVNLHDFLIGVRGGLAQGVVERTIRVDARGAPS